MPEGFVPPVGTIVTRPRLAKTLQRLASEGPDYFYKGEWAHHFVQAVNATGGMMTLDDSAGYQVRWEEPLRTTYRDVEIVTAPPPANGGALIALVMNMAEQFDLDKMPYYTESPKTLALLRRIFSAAENSVIEYVHDPLSCDVPIDTLVSKDYAKMLARLINGSFPMPSAVTTTSAEQALPASGEMSEHGRLYSDTNHLVIVDAMGNMVSATHTVYGSTFATGLVVDGVMVNSGNSFPGTANGKGRRVVSPFPATIVMRDGKPFLGIGSPGLASKAVAIALVNLLGFKKDLVASVGAPRFDGNEPTALFQVETQVPQKVLAGLADYGIRVRPTAPYSWHLGSVQAVMRDQKTGELTGVADPRRAGYAAGY